LWFSQSVLPRAADLGVNCVIVVGDFGLWPNAELFMEAARGSLRTHGVPTLFIKGNHEHQAWLAKLYLNAKTQAGPEVANLGGSLYYIPAAGVVEIAGLRVTALGGAVSIDQYDLAEGITWFSDEVVSMSDLYAIEAAGPADVLLTHDAPSGWDVPASKFDSDISYQWGKMLPAIEAHREVVRQGYEVVAPKLLVHGHYHVGYEIDVEESWGTVKIAGLDKDNTAHWGRVLTSTANQPVLSDYV
jgi:hypothetical protein